MMSQMPPVIIADTSCLILLEKIGELGLLQKLYSQVLITPVIAVEFGLPLPMWISVQSPADTVRFLIIKTSIDAGEASAIALALEQQNCLLIMDDLQGRLFAKSLNLPVTGTLGVLLQAKAAGVLPAVKPLLEKITKTNFRITETLMQAVLRKAGEEV